MQWCSLDELLETDHQARLVWIAVCGLNLGRWLTQFMAVERNVGRNSTDPRLLVARGFMPRSRGSAALARLHVCARSMWPTDGCAVG